MNKILLKIIFKIIFTFKFKLIFKSYIFIDMYRNVQVRLKQRKNEIFAGKKIIQNGGYWI